MKDCHFTLLPVNDLTGRLRFVAIIFPGENVKMSWAHGVDVFKPLNEKAGKYLTNFGPGKRFPGLVLTYDDGSEVPAGYFTTPSTSMDANVLREIYETMEEKRIFLRGEDERGKYEPASIVDGHTSRLGETFLKYINSPDTKVWGVLGLPYATHKWQPHDDTRQNGMFKMW